MMVILTPIVLMVVGIPRVRMDKMGGFPKIVGKPPKMDGENHGNSPKKRNGG